jgi:2-dehydro-3-deoxyglucarate aldolase/4-hydroxy-2-oxoheptanedioate aldolase
MTQAPPKIGTWLSIGSPAVAELAALCGFDWVLIDLEHGSAPECSVLDQLRALQGTSTKGIVRVPALHSDVIARMLDWGADGIMVPHVNSAREASAIVEAASYPPAGKRGFSRTVRAHRYGLRPPETTDRPLIIAQIETGEAVCAADEIASVNGIDVLFIGPADLQLDLEVRPQTPPITYSDCLRRVVKAASAAGKAAGILLRDAGALNAHTEMGFHQIAVDGDLSILRKAYQSTIQPRP